jgi:monoamine oxidase
MEGSMRVDGGMRAIITELARGVDPARVLPGNRVTALRVDDGGVEVDAIDPQGCTITHPASHVITALPLRVLACTIAFDPPLPDAVTRSWTSVPTWMAGQAKFIAVYTEAFWRNAGLSGEARSRVGPMVEIHDASAGTGLPALSGFVGVAPAGRAGAGDRIVNAAVAQLVRLFGPRAGVPAVCLYKDWATDRLIATHDDAEPLVAHPEYGRHAVPPQPWAGRLLLAGTEAASRHGGYMEGALEAAEAAVGALGMQWLMWEAG